MGKNWDWEKHWEKLNIHKCLNTSEISRKFPVSQFSHKKQTNYKNKKR
jgi:hypothetical protein